MADLPPGFILKQPAPAASSGDSLPPGFVLKSQPDSSYNPLTALGQYATGVVEGTAGLGALAADLNPFAMLTGQGARISRDSDGGFTIKMPASEAVASLVKDYLPEEDPQYRYSRTFGNFTGPGGVAKGAAKVVGTAAPKLAGFLARQGGLAAQTSATMGALGSQGAEDVAGDSAVAPLIGAVFGAATPSIFSNIFKTGRSVFLGGSPQEIKGSAAKALQELTDLDPKQIEDAIRAMPEDQLGALMTTAELTDNAGMAQIEKTLAGKPEFAQTYNARLGARDAARESIIDSVSLSGGVNKEGFGSKIINKATAVADDMQEGADKIWKSIPRDLDIPVKNQQIELSNILNARKGGLSPNSKVKTLTDQFLNKGSERGAMLESGALQDIRSDALSLLRDANLTPFEQRILNQIQQGADDAMEQGLFGPDYERWIDAREFTKKKAETFRRGSVGGYLTSRDARPATVFDRSMKGDSQSIQEFRAAIANDPGILEEAKRAFVDMIPRDAQGKITPNKMKKFLSSNEGAVIELLGKNHAKALGRVLEDLQSEAAVSQKGFAASKGSSATAQRQTVAGAIRDAAVEGATPGAYGPIARMIGAMKDAAEIKDAAAVNDWLFKASLDPFVAKMLAETPTDERVMNVLGRLWKATKDGAREGTSRGASLQLLRKAREEAGSGEGEDPQKPQQSYPQSRQFESPERTQKSALERNEQQSQHPQYRPLSLLQLSGAGTKDMSPSQAVSQSTQASSSAQNQMRRYAQERQAPRGGIGTIPSPNPAQSYDETQAVFNRISGVDMRNPETPEDVELIIDAIKQVESSGGKFTTGPKTKYGVAKGSYQVLDTTGQEYHQKLGIDEPYDPYNEEQQREIVRAILGDYMRMFDGDIELALTAYHTGPGNVRKGKIGPQGRAYVPKIEKAIDKLVRQV